MQPRDDDGQARFSNIVHWGYGTSWGAARGLLHAAGLDGGKATAVHFAAVWGGRPGDAPCPGRGAPALKSPAKEIAIDAFHHAVYAVATGVAFAALERSSS